MTVVRTILSEMQVHPQVASDGYAPLRDILDGTRGFAGCLGLELLVDRDDPCLVVLVVRWASDHDYTSYRAWRAGDGAADLGRLLAAPSRLRWLAPL